MEERKITLLRRTIPSDFSDSSFEERQWDFRHLRKRGNSGSGIGGKETMPVQALEDEEQCNFGQWKKRIWKR